MKTFEGRWGYENREFPSSISRLLSSLPSAGRRLIPSLIVNLAFCQKSLPRISDHNLYEAFQKVDPKSTCKGHNYHENAGDVGCGQYPY
jgi:hypothetical protein